MSLFVSTAESTNANIPKFVDDKFVLRNNYYIVTNGTLFNSYPIKAYPSQDTDQIIRFERNPPTLLEGVVVIGRKVYSVSSQDLLRKVIRKSKEVQQEASNESTTRNSRNAASLEAIINSTGDAPVSDFFESGLIEASELEISKAADAAWDEQIRALLDTSFEEEEWEIEDAA